MAWDLPVFKTGETAFNILSAGQKWKAEDFKRLPNIEICQKGC